MPRSGYGKSTPRERRQKEVKILDIYGRWVIVNVLWERKPGQAD